MALFLITLVSERNPKTMAKPDPSYICVPSPGVLDFWRKTSGASNGGRGLQHWTRISGSKRECVSVWIVDMCGGLGRWVPARAVRGTG